MHSTAVSYSPIKLVSVMRLLAMTEKFHPWLIYLIIIVVVSKQSKNNYKALKYYFKTLKSILTKLLMWFGPKFDYEGTQIYFSDVFFFVLYLSNKI